MGEVVVRPATVADLGGVARARIEGWQHGYRGLLPAAYLDSLDVEADRDRRQKTWSAGGFDRFDMLVAVAGGQPDEVLGFSMSGPYRLSGPDCLSSRDPDGDYDEAIGELYAMYVRPARWGRGVGRALMAATVRRIRGHERSPVRLWVLAANVRARRFYERCGWVADGATQPLVLEFDGSRYEAPEVRYTLATEPGPSTG